MKNFRKMCRGEKGFTLIELLVVIIILGVLAAVVTLAVTRFIGKGVLESANAELVTVQTAIEAALAEGNATGFDGDGPYLFTGQLGAGNPSIVSGSDNTSVYLQLRQHKLKATYTINKAGEVIFGDAGGGSAASPWGTTKIRWNGASGVLGGQWEKVPAA